MVVSTIVQLLVVVVHLGNGGAVRGAGECEQASERLNLRNARGCWRLGEWKVEAASNVAPRHSPSHPPPQEPKGHPAPNLDSQPQDKNQCKLGDPHAHLVTDLT